MLLNCGVGEDSLRVLWTARRSNQSNIKEMSAKYSLEGLMLKLKFQYFGHLMRRANSSEKTLMLGYISMGILWRYRGFSSRPGQHSEGHECFGFPVHIKVLFTLYCSLLSVQPNSVWKKNVHTLFKNTLLLKNANHHQNFQQVVMSFSKR